MADKIYTLFIPNTRAIDNGDGTYSVSVEVRPESDIWVYLAAIPTTAMRGTDNALLAVNYVTERGTDNAALASVCTNARLAELDSANLPTNIDDILDAVSHTSYVYPANTNLTVTLTALNTANSYSNWAEITDSGATTFSSLFAAASGHISSLIIETVSENTTIYMLQMAYGDSKTLILESRFAGSGKFQAPNVQNRMWTLTFPAGETIYYRMKSATAVADTCTIHLRYHLH